MNCGRRLKRHPRRQIGIPKGMLFHITLSILKRASMSGIELMDEIEYYTDWRPSPGSVYPLLSKLEEQRLITPVESEDPTLKRYGLTPTGVQAVEEYRKLASHVRSRYHSIHKMYWRLFEGMREELFEAQSSLFKAIEKIHPLLKNDLDASSRIRELLLETVKEIEKINRQVEAQE